MVCFAAADALDAVQDATAVEPPFAVTRAEDAAASALLPGGRLVVTVASVDGAYADRLRRAEREALCSFNDVIIEDWTQGVIPFAQRTYEWWLNAPWPPAIQEKSAREARTALRAIGMGNFHYAVLFALK